LIKGGTVERKFKITIAVQIKEKKSYNTFLYKAIKGFARMEIDRKALLSCPHPHPNCLWIVCIKI
jgi:hypothetical protein